MGRRDARWAWSKVGVVHGDFGCDGELRSYRYRFYPPSDAFYERCVGYVWCAVCREYSGAMVHVPRNVHLVDLLADLPERERERERRSEVRLLDHLARRG